MTKEQIKKALKTLADRYDGADDYNKPAIGFYLRKIYAEICRCTI
jgi:hypothetical protein